MQTTPPRLLIPGLRPFYAFAEPISWALVRLTVGLMILSSKRSAALASPSGSSRASGPRRSRSRCS